ALRQSAKVVTRVVFSIANPCTEESGLGKPISDMSDSSLQRREFLKRLGLAGAGLAIGGAEMPQSHAQENQAKPGEWKVPRRKFGRHDFTVSALALGGHALRLASDEEAAKMIDTAEELGIDFLDNCWD